MKWPWYIMPLIGFVMFFSKPFFDWNLSWRLSFLIGVFGYTCGAFIDRGFRGSY